MPYQAAIAFQANTAQETFNNYCGQMSFAKWVEVFASLYSWAVLAEVVRREAPITPAAGRNGVLAQLGHIWEAQAPK